MKISKKMLGVYKHEERKNLPRPKSKKVTDAEKDVDKRMLKAIFGTVGL